MDKLILTLFLLSAFVLVYFAVLCETPNIIRDKFIDVLKYFKAQDLVFDRKYSKKIFIIAGLTFLAFSGVLVLDYGLYNSQDPSKYLKSTLNHLHQIGVKKLHNKSKGKLLFNPLLLTIRSYTLQLAISAVLFAIIAVYVEYFYTLLLGQVYFSAVGFVLTGVFALSFGLEAVLEKFGSIQKDSTIDPGMDDLRNAFLSVQVLVLLTFELLLFFYYRSWAKSTSHRTEQGRFYIQGLGIPMFWINYLVSLLVLLVLSVGLVVVYVVGKGTLYDEVLNQDFLVSLKYVLRYQVLKNKYILLGYLFLIKLVISRIV